MEFFTSDLHLNHANICSGTSKWSDIDKNCRHFDDLAQMNNAIITSINSCVGKNDTLYHDGDLCFGGWENIWHYRKQIICENIININGNHDHHIEKDKFFPFLENNNGVITEIEDRKNYRHLGLLKHKKDVTAKDLFKETYTSYEDKPALYIEIRGQKIALNHYPLKTWDGIEDGVWLLCGHEHSRYKDFEFGKWLDLDWGRFKKPLSFDEVKFIMDSREISLKTNVKSH